MVSSIPPVGITQNEHFLNCDTVLLEVRYIYCCISKTGKVKGKVIPLQVLTDLQGSRRLRLPDFKTIGT
jgi:hypothetical protein